MSTGVAVTVERRFFSPRARFTLKLSAVMLLIDLQITPPVNVFFQLLGAAILLSDELMESPYMWAAVFAILAAADFHVWRSLDNHQFLILYWYLACLLSTRSSTPGASLCWQARVLVSLTFLAAVVTKVVNGEYADGGFIHFTALTDPRIQWLVSPLTGIRLDDLVENHRRLDAMLLSAQAPSSLALHTSRTLAGAAKPVGWCLIAFESAIAILFCPVWKNTRTRVIADLLLVIFILGTYFILPVIGFGSLLATLGYAQSEERSCGLRLSQLYIGALIAIQFAKFLSPIYR